MPRINKKSRVTVDLGDLRSEVFARSSSRGIPASALVRELLAAALAAQSGIAPLREPDATAEPLTRIWLRLTPHHAATLRAAARSHAISVGAYVAGVAAGTPVLTIDGPRRPDHLKALIQANAEMSTLSRDIRHLASLLGHGQVEAALEYRSMLESLADDVRRHVDAAATVLAQLQARPGGEKGMRKREGQSS